MQLINAKMAPIFERDDGTAFGERMDIFNHINSTLGDGPQVAPLVNADIPVRATPDCSWPDCLYSLHSTKSYPIFSF